MPPRRTGTPKRAPAPETAHPPQPMEAAAKIALLQRLVDQAEQVKIRDSDDPVFKTWKNTVERTLIRIYGQPSPEVEQFRNPRFFYHAIIMTLGTDYSHQHRQCFDRDFQILTSSLRGYVEELQNEQAHERLVPLPVPATTCRERPDARIHQPRCAGCTVRRGADRNPRDDRSHARADLLHVVFRLRHRPGRQFSRGDQG